VVSSKRLKGKQSGEVFGADFAGEVSKRASVEARSIGLGAMLGVTEVRVM
jgi:hypothetical protein